MMMEQNQNFPPDPQVVDTKVSWQIGEELINAVISAAVWSEGQRPGIWQKMIEALNQGAAKTREGTINAFLFRAMIDRLLEEFRDLNT
jgi:hypothetical protein